MKKYAFINPNGDAAYTASPATDDTYIDGEVYNGLMCREIPQIADDTEVIERWYWVGDDHFVRPPKPTDFHDWSGVTKSWLPNLDAARESKLQQVVAELNKRLYLPCNGFDADNVSRDRISGTIARLQRGDGLPAGWMGWRDAANEMHWADDDAATVLANLIMLSRAIEDREQALLVASWGHKANIASLTDIGAIIAYDVTTGWST